MYDEENLLMISALQHFLFCPRQCALIHLEQQWTENRYTAEGRIFHERVHTAAKESRKKVKVEFDVPVCSLEFGVIGRADIVEFHLQEDKRWVPFPVEYKRGRPKKNDSDRVQLCAQAICLEEMLKIEVPEGALYYGKKKRRVKVLFDESLRKTTIETAKQLHVLLNNKKTPPPNYHSGCDSCSFHDTCLPKTTGTSSKVSQYLKKVTSS